MATKKSRPPRAADAVQVPVPKRPELLVTVKARNPGAAPWVDFVAQEVALLLHDVGAYDVTKIGDWTFPNDREERVQRLRRRLNAAAVDVAVVVEADDEEPSDG
jgi:hypothetical protein